MKRRKGQILVMFIVLMPVLLMVLGMVVDIGRVILAQSYLYSVADAVSLGGARFALDDEATSRSGKLQFKPEVFADSGDDTIKKMNDANKNWKVYWTPNRCKSTQVGSADCVFRENKSAFAATVHVDVPMLFTGIIPGFPKEFKLKATAEGALKFKK